MTANEQYEEALATRRAVLGDEYLDSIMATGTSFGSEFQTFVTRVCWGEAWLDGSLDLRTRSLVTLAIVAAIGQRREIGLHFAGALRNGCTETELAGVLKHVALYAGMGAGAQAFSLAEEELRHYKDESSRASSPTVPETTKELGE